MNKLNKAQKKRLSDSLNVYDAAATGNQEEYKMGREYLMDTLADELSRQKKELIEKLEKKCHRYPDECSVCLMQKNKLKNHE